jgi:hypothetical protein
MLVLFKHLVQNGYTLNPNPFGGTSKFILRSMYGDFTLPEQKYNEAYRLSQTKILRALYATT